MLIICAADLDVFVFELSLFSDGFNGSGNGIPKVSVL